MPVVDNETIHCQGKQAFVTYIKHHWEKLLSNLSVNILHFLGASSNTLFKRNQRVSCHTHPKVSAFQHFSSIWLSFPICRLFPILSGACSAKFNKLMNSYKNWQFVSPLKIFFKGLVVGNSLPVILKTRFARHLITLTLFNSFAG